MPSNPPHLKPPLQLPMRKKVTRHEWSRWCPCLKCSRIVTPLVSVLRYYCQEQFFGHLKKTRDLLPRPWTVSLTCLIIRWYIRRKSSYREHTDQPYMYFYHKQWFLWWEKTLPLDPNTATTSLQSFSLKMESPSMLVSQRNTHSTHTHTHAHTHTHQHSCNT